MAIAITGTTEDKGATSGTDSAGTGRFKSREAGGLDGAWSMDTGCTHRRQQSVLQAGASLTRIGTTLTTSCVTCMMTGNFGVVFMMTEESGIRLWWLETLAWYP